MVHRHGMTDCRSDSISGLHRGVEMSVKLHLTFPLVGVHAKVRVKGDDYRGVPTLSGYRDPQMVPINKRAAEAMTICAYDMRICQS